MQTARPIPPIAPVSLQRTHEEQVPPEARRSE